MNIQKQLYRLKNIFHFTGEEAYLVGGIIRDYYLKRDIKDIDLVVSGNVKKLSKKFARINHGKWISLDEYRHIYRVIIDNVIYDFTGLEGKDIIEDLQRRDFTINALALPLKVINILQNKNNNIPEEKVIDGCQGLRDLRQGVIRAVTDSTFQNDPIRLLRAIRFRGQLRFTITKKTSLLINDAVDLLKRVAGERIRDEFYKIFSLQKPWLHLEYMEEEFNLLSCIIPQIEKMKQVGKDRWHSESAWQHSLLTLKELANLLQKGTFTKYLTHDNYTINNEHIDENIYLLNIAALFHDIGKLKSKEKIKGENHYYGHEETGADLIEKVLKGLHFSSQDISWIKDMVRLHMYPLYLYQAENLTVKGYYRFFKKAGHLTPFICLLSAADVIATRNINNLSEEGDLYLEFIENMLIKYEKMYEKTKESFLNGNEIMEILSIEEGPEVGQLLAKLNEAQATGEIQNRQQALEFLQKLKDE